jgi:alcohol dehydrogenase class IV
VITKTENQDKSAIWNSNIFAKVAIVDPELMLTLPKSVTAQTGFDAFAHNFEAYLSNGTNPYIEAISLEGIRLIAKNLPIALENGTDLGAREAMAWADTLGGLSISSAGVTLPHGIGMQISGHCPHVTHGQSLAVQYPAFTRFTFKWAVEKFAAVGRIFNPALNSLSDDAAAEASCEEIDKFLKKIGLYIGLKDINVSKDKIRAIAETGQVLNDYKNNPRLASVEEMYNLLLESYER